MTRPKTKTLFIAAAMAAVGAIFVFGRSAWREHYYHLTTSGGLGCGIGTVHVISGGVDYSITTGLDTPLLLGRRLDANELVQRFDRRFAAVPATIDGWREHRYSREEYELVLAVNLLIQTTHPETLRILTRLLDDPAFQGRAVKWLIEFGDTRACPALLEAWRKRPEYPFAYLDAFRTLHDPRAVSPIIDTFSIHMGEYDADTLFTTIEIITGESLQQFRGRPLGDRASVESLKIQLHEWWAEHPKNDA